VAANLPYFNSQIIIIRWKRYCITANYNMLCPQLYNQWN